MAKFQDRFLLTYLEISPDFCPSRLQFAGYPCCGLLFVPHQADRSEFHKIEIRISLACCVNCCRTDMLISRVTSVL